MSDSVSEHRPPAAVGLAATLRCKRVVRKYARGSGSFLSRGSDIPTVRTFGGVSLPVSTGEFVAIAGSSGSGKSTLLHLPAALDTPIRGDIRVASIDVRSLSNCRRTKLRRDTIGVVSQHFHLLPSLSARGDVAFPLIERGASRHDRHARVKDLLEQAGLGDRASHKLGELSGDKQQHVAITRALVSDLAALIVDEPTSELDTETGQRALDYVEQIAMERTVVVVTYDKRAIERVDRVVRLRDSRVTSDS